MKTAILSHLLILPKGDRLSQQLQQHIEAWQALLEKLGGSESAIASPHPAKRDRIQQLQQQIEAGQALLESWEGMNERSLFLMPNRLSSDAVAL